MSESFVPRKKRREDSKIKRLSKCPEKRQMCCKQIVLRANKIQLVPRRHEG
jgi:ribosomal protein S12